MPELKKKNIKKHLAKIIIGFVITCFSVVGFFFVESAMLKNKIQKLENLNFIYIKFLGLQNPFVDMETGLRGYVIEQDKKFLEPYDAAIIKYKSVKEDLYRATHSNYELQKNYREVIEAQEVWMRFASIAIRKIQDKSETSLVDHKSELGKFKFDIVRTKSTVFIENVEQLLSQARKGYTDYKSKARIVGIIFAIVISTLFVFFLERELRSTLRFYFELISQLQEKEEEAIKASKSKDLFLANMSHEIRTPLSSIIGFSEIIEQKETLSTEGLTHISFIRKNSKYLLSLINDLFDISKIANDKIDVIDEKIDLKLFIKDLKNMFLSRTENKQIDLNFRMSSTIPSFIVNDSTRLKQILANLISNAVKFTSNGKTIEVIFSSKDHKLVVDIIDQGIGIKPEQQSSIFESFVQADESHARSYGGAGLGLALSNRLASIIGGKLELVSSELSVGSHFRLTLNLTEGDELSLIEDSEFLNKEKNVSAVGFEVEHFNFEGSNILIAEDARENQTIFKIYLEPSKARIKIVDNGAEAVREILGGEKFDIVLMDIQMPGMDGYEAIKVLRNSDYKGTVIALTAHAMKGEREKCLSAGFDSYLTKPVSQITLLSNIQKHLIQSDEIFN